MTQSDLTPQNITAPLLRPLEIGTEPRYIPMLICVEGPQAGNRYYLKTGDNSLGRGDNADVPVIDAMVSRNHSVIHYTSKPGVADPDCVITDAGSRNGTEVNGQTIVGSHRLRERDRILIGETILGFFLRDEKELESDRLLYEMATRDALTGLDNRHQFRAHMNHYVRRSARSNRALSLIFSDVDSFKDVNDTYGHDAGDRVLLHIGKLLEQSCREGEICARWGGEEFAILLPDVDTEEALNVAERLRSAVEDARVTHLNTEIRVTISLGVAQMQSGETPDDLFRRADQNLLKAKQSGKNQVAAS